ncbi:MAG: hypothetical protein HGB35_06110 [Geobacteraceae bacterium]|nr:hypothetical protein [Geobacteraceae bacterium]
MQKFHGSPLHSLFIHSDMPGKKSLACRTGGDAVATLFAAKFTINLIQQRVFVVALPIPPLFAYCSCLMTSVSVL